METTVPSLGWAAVKQQPFGLLSQALRVWSPLRARTPADNRTTDVAHEGRNDRVASSISVSASLSPLRGDIHPNIVMLMHFIIEVNKKYKDAFAHRYLY